MNPNAPHKAVIWIQAEVHEVTQHGEMSGNPAHEVTRFPVALGGPNKSVCINKLTNLIEEIREKCRN